MSGQKKLRIAGQRVFVLLALSLLASATTAQPREATEPIGGITFDPARRASIRHKSGQLIRGELIGISQELIHFRVQSGKEFQYDLKDVRSIATVDGEFKYASAYDTYREIVEKARGLSGVSIDSAAAVAGTGKAIELPRPPIPQLPEMVDPPSNYTFDDDVQIANAGPGHLPGIPNQQVAPAAAAAGSGMGQPFYESNGFKVGFLVACLAVVALWWRNKV